MTNEGTNYLFVIDTNQYAGNFEREMCAFLTGCVGECEVGDEMAERYRKDMGKAGHYLFSNVASVPDDRGCSRPVTIWSNPRYANDGHGGHYFPAYLSVGIWFETKPSAKQIELLKNRSALFPKVYLDANKRYGEQEEIKVESFRLVEFNKTSKEETL